jgi:hypothetical protein
MLFIVSYQMYTQLHWYLLLTFFNLTPEHVELCLKFRHTQFDSPKLQQFRGHLATLLPILLSLLATYLGYIPCTL